MRKTFRTVLMAVSLLAVVFISFAFVETGGKDDEGKGIEIGYAYRGPLTMRDGQLMRVDYILQTDGVNSLFFADKKIFREVWEKPTMTDSFPGTMRSFSNNSQGMFFDGSESTFYYDPGLLTRKYLVADQNAIGRLAWKTLDSTTNILGYECGVAKMQFRGREYFATYAPELPYNIGPLKARNLPGAILKLEIPEMKISIEATRVDPVEIIRLANPYLALMANQEPISLNEFLEEAGEIGGSKRKKAGTNKNGRPKPGINVVTLELED